MRARILVLVVIGASLALTFACTSASVVGENPTPPADAAADVAPDVAMVADAAPDTAVPDASTPDADAEAGCIDLGGMGSSGTSGCLSGTAYDCGGTRVSITCECPAATCRCATGGTFAHDCTKGCTASPQEREQCGVPEPTPSDGGSSGGSSGASASSSNG